MNNTYPVFKEDAILLMIVFLDLMYRILQKNSPGKSTYLYLKTYFCNAKNS